MISDERLKKMVDPRSAFDFPDNFESKEMARELLERRQADRWIPVSERLPKTSDDILFNVPWCYGVEKGRFSEGKFIGDRTSPQNDQLDWTIDEVTEWRPLPTPPQEQK